MLMYCFYNVVPSKEESENTESSAPDQDDDEPEGAIAGDTTDLFSAVSSTPFAFPKGPSDISKSKEQGPVQPSLTNFPRTQHGTRKRTFHSSWYKDYSWLEYSVIKDSSYCFACRHFSLPNAPDSVFASHSGFSNWKKALSKESGFKLHSKLEHHVNAMYAWSQYKRANEGNTTMLNSINTNRKKVVEENRYYIKTIADVLLLTATQNIAQRGHRESGDSRNKGNFLAILDEIAKHDQLIEKKLRGCANAKYTSHQIQNEILQGLAEMVQTEIIKEVKECEVFSVIADETKDLQKKEQMSLVVRYYYNGVIHESFLCFQAAESLNAAGLSAMIISCLEKHGLDYRNNLVGQGYDGASVMSGKHSGVSARIQSNARFAFYVHCNAHCLNLVLVDATKAVPEVVDFFALLQQLHNFVSGSYVHLRWLDVQKELYPAEQPRELQALSDTRWACRYTACRTMRDRLPAVLRLLQDIALERNGERTVEARGLLLQIDIQFLGLLVTFCKVLGDAKCLSDMLQSSTLDLARAVDLVGALIDTFQDYRNEKYFDELWKEVEELAEKSKISVKIDRRNPRLSSKFLDSLVMSTIGQRKCDDEGFPRPLFNQVLDCLIAELKRRFSKKNCEIMQGVQSLNPKSATFLNEEPLIAFGHIFESDLDDLKHEVHQIRRLLDQRIKSDLGTPSTLLDFILFLEPYKEVLHELFRLCKIAVVSPVSTASCERSFSALKLIKSYLRTTMADARLSHIGTLSIESRRARGLNMDDFVTYFASSHNNRRILLL
ncbi:zinc finger MYM-type protein 1-like isoform X1 [Xiphophorus hellerii]|uniref:zinc finger MYM-type protein 1-like isoform X1 n=1 Tax=Xiphophorus hellerii TaxID=8084 RepID=UPI0013B3B2A0|nr:zinc finger MYM-type protein 1-like isoform X1 [Xiphophorus hellerii]